MTPLLRPPACWVPFLLLGILAGNLLAGCDGEGERIAKDVALRNAGGNTQAIHILGPRESFSSSNRLAPRQERIFSHEAVLGAPVNFRAGREGEVIANCSVDWPAVSVVTWDEAAGALVC